MTLIVALDFDSEAKTMALVEQLSPSLCALKVGLQLYTTLGPAIVRTLVNKGFKVFLDLKFHDIPNTVAQACKAAADLGVWMMNVHAAGGPSMMQAAMDALTPLGQNRPLLIAVTVLTSLSETEFNTLHSSLSLTDYVLQMASMAKQTNLDGVVSVWEVPAIKTTCGQDFLTITPGIRPADTSHRDDQQRTSTPQEAIEAGSDYLVVGRPITAADDPLEALKNLHSRRPPA